MELYNKIMTFFWLLLSVGSAIVITYFGFTEGFNRWTYYYAVPVVALVMYFFKKWMVKRMHRHMEYLNEKNKQA
ncbi:MAG: hypothetical protein ACO1O6_13990 [Bacteroidota bacterium]